MAKNPITIFEDGFSDFTAGINSGIAPILLPKNQLSYATNATVRGRYVTHRPSYQIQKLVFEEDISLAGLLFQGACYYKPDFGNESIMAQIGGRLFQFIPDTGKQLFVYDRTVRSYAGGSNFTTNNTIVSQAGTFSVTLLNVDDAAGQSYATGTKLTTDPSFAGVLGFPATIPPVVVNNNTQLQYTFNAVLPPGVPLPKSLTIGSQVFINKEKLSNPVKWTILDNTQTQGSSAVLKLQYTEPPYGSGAVINYPAGSTITTAVNPSSPQQVGTTLTDFTSPSVGATVIVMLNAPYGGQVGDGLTIGSGIYSVTAVSNIQSSTQSFSVTTESSTANSVDFSYDTNPAGSLQAWLWQAENYVIVQDGQSRPVFFDGASSRRAKTATFVGALAQSFGVPQFGTPATMVLNAPFKDSVGTYLNINPFGLFPFLVRVIAVNVGGDSNSVSILNVTGLQAVNTIIPIGTPVNSTSSPVYAGVLSAGINQNPAMPTPGEQITISVAPPFTGQVGDTLALTDGTGGILAYQLKVISINGGGTGLVVQNINAPVNTIFSAGFPVISLTNAADELPVGRMGAYVQGRNWISSPDGKYFVVGDLVGSAAGSQAVTFRDAVLKWSQNTAAFNIPGGAGQINCIIALSALDASLGQGPLQILCDNDIFNCSAPADSTLWASVTTPILSESAIGFGGVGQNAAVVSNSDLILKSRDATIHSLKLARQDFNQWGSMPISQEVNRVVKQENVNLLSFITAAISDNRCLMSCSPINGPKGVYSQGAVAIDFDVTSSIQGKLPSVYDGVWKDLNFLQVVTGKFNKVDRTFAFSLNAATSTVEVWEITKTGIFDNGETPITWSFETPVMFSAIKGKGELQLVTLEDGAIWIKNLTGQAKIKVWWRPDYDSCWHFWRDLSICADNLASGATQQRLRLGLGIPPVDDCDTSIDKKANVGRFFQMRFEITGSLTFMAGLFVASLDPESRLAVFDQNEGTQP